MANINLHNIDCMEYMRGIKNKGFNVAFSDPEYGIKESSKNHNSRNTPVSQKNGVKLKINDPNYQKKNWDDKPAGAKYFNELFRVSKNQIIFGANYFESIIGEPGKPPRRNEYEQFLKDHPTGFIIWDKVNGENDFSDCEIIYTSFDFPSYVLYYMWAGMMQGVSIKYGTIQQGNKKLNEKRIHPTQKPKKIYEYLLKRYVPGGSKILDTHGGSMNIAIACEEMGFDLELCELDQDYYKAGVKRFNTYKSQMKLIF